MLWGKFKFSFSFRARNVQWGILLKMVCCIVSWLIGRCTLEFCESLGYSSFPSYSFHSFCHPFLQSFVMQVSYHGQFIPFIVNSVSAQCSFTSSFILFSFTGASILGVEGREPPKFWAGGRVVGVAGLVVDGSWNIILSYHVQEVYSKVVTFEEK